MVGVPLNAQVVETGIAISDTFNCYQIILTSLRIARPGGLVHPSASLRRKERSTVSECMQSFAHNTVMAVHITFFPSSSFLLFHLFCLSFSLVTVTVSVFHCSFLFSSLSIFLSLFLSLFLSIYAKRKSPTHLPRLYNS